MIRYVEFLIAVAIVAVIFVLVGALLPSHRYVTQSVDTSRPLPVVFDLMSGFGRYKDWSPAHLGDARATFNLSGPDMGVGAQVDYASTKGLVGSGTWRITAIDPGKKIDIAVNNSDYGDNKRVVFTFERIGLQKQVVRITQEYYVDYGWNLFGRYAGLYVSRSVGDPMKASLNSLGNLINSIPKFDYTNLAVPPKIVKTPAENLLVAPTKAKRDNAELQSAMSTQEKWLQQVMDKNGLEAAGPLRVITDDFGADVYAFELAVPVRKKGSKDAADAPPPQLDVKIDNSTGNNPVKYVQQPAGTAVTTTYSGHMAQLSVIREQIRAWSVVHSVSLSDHPYEIYNKGIATSFSPDGDFISYWPIKPAGAK
ncbi:MAG: polyketide cyclase [Proteobacteria bacterium]|nr:polyketide cyclase [Pseudomonadota bacterium]